MNVHSASRRLAPPARFLLAASTAGAAKSLPVAIGVAIQKRNKWSLNPLKKLKNWVKGSNTDPDFSSLDDPKKRKKFLESKMQGKAEDNIFQDEIRAANQANYREDSGANITAATEKTRENTAMVLDPEPLHRMRWQRRKVIQMVRKNGKLSHEEKIKMTERQLTHKSELIPTSVKKLMMLSRQISGKTVDDAITQMTWSKKKMSAEVKYYLEEARDLAIAQQGMGLGKVNGDVYAKPKKIQTKDGKWLEVVDPSRLYIAQSWVGRGPWRGFRIDYKGRGRSGRIKHPATSLTIQLKEERTRVREYEEDKASKEAKRPWVHLPNRTIYGQRPYYTW